jgi:pSer/pThr/pTyr-binding forkhead associated (FHA) protein
MAHLTVLRFVHGKYEGQEFPLDGGGFLAGRSSDADLVLADDAVSRKHARFFPSRGRIWVRDLGSRNGTVINGRAVDVHCLREGDRLTIGSSLARVESREQSQVSARRAGEQRRGRPNDTAGRSMSGSIEDIPLMDVLQWLATSRKTGALKVRDTEHTQTGVLHLRDGRVFYANIEGNTDLHPEKALMRMLHWSKGMFELDNQHLDEAPEEINMSLEHMLMEAARQEDELAALAKKAALPAPGANVRLIVPCSMRWKELSPEQVDLVQDLVEMKSWWSLIDRSRTDDLTLTRTLVELKTKNVVDY